MKKKKDSIAIDKVEGDVIISQDQKGGTTSHATPLDKGSTKKRKWTYISIVVGFVASVFTILSYFNINLPREESKPSQTSISKDSTVKLSQPVTSKEAKRHSMLDKKEDKNITIQKVEGDVVISQNQSGGITAHSVNVNQAIEPEWSIGTSEKVTESEWRAKLIARGRGNMAFYNWNILLTLNTPVIRREDVPGEATVGPWMPLNVSGGQLSPNHFFLGFSEFKPGQGFAIYLYTKEPISVQKVDVLSNK